MKLSFAIPADLDALSIAEFEEIIKAVSDMGYQAVEPLINDPSKVCIAEVFSILDKYNIKISGLRSGSVYGKNGWRLSSPDVDNRNKAIERLKEVIALAGVFKTNVMIGLMQGHLEEGESLEEAESRIIDALRECSEYAEQYDVFIMYEAVNRFELEYHNTTEQIVHMLDRINEGLKHPVKLLADVYHMHLEDPSIPSALIRSIPYMGHVHFADSTRRSPGTGCIDFAEIIKDLLAMDYAGYVAVEVTPIPDLLSSASDSISYLKPIIAAMS